MADILNLRVAAITRLTDRIKMFELRAVEGELPAFEAGAHIELNTGYGIVRNYSIANDPSERHRYVIAVLRESLGVGSNWMHDSVVPGTALTAKGPCNGFELDESADDYVLLAGGIGITPLRSMAFRLRARHAHFRLVHCTRSREETAFYSDLKDTFGDAVRFHHDGGDASRSLDFKALLADRPTGAQLYICGPLGLIDAARRAASHWPAGSVRFELFSSPAAEPSALAPQNAASSKDEAFEVELRRSGKVINVRPDETILDAMLAAGVKTPHVCKEGWCGNCQLSLLAGKADHRDEVLTDDQKAANNLIHVCISRAAAGETRLVIDR
jgi:ferredoxin-NADP reductase